MKNMGSHPTPGIPRQSEHSLDENGLQFGLIALVSLALICENKRISWGKQLRQMD
jgi:hypothetical protein